MFTTPDRQRPHALPRSVLGKRHPLAPLLLALLASGCSADSGPLVGRGRFVNAGECYRSTAGIRLRGAASVSTGAVIGSLITTEVLTATGAEAGSDGPDCRGWYEVDSTRLGRGWACADYLSPAACGSTPPAGEVPSSNPGPGAGPLDFLGLHDCTEGGAIGGTPGPGEGCSGGARSLLDAIGGRWVSLLGAVGGPAKGGALNGGRTGASLGVGYNVLLRLDWQLGSAFPPVLDDGEYATFGQHLTQWLNDFGSNAGYIMLGNEMDSINQEYHVWGEGESGPDVISCAISGEGARRVQYMTPARYARFFKAATDARPDLPWALPPLIPFVQNHNPSCPVYTAGDYLAALSAQGAAGRVRAVGVHLQGVVIRENDGHIPESYQGDLVQGIRRATLARLNSLAGGINRPILVKEIHPAPAPYTCNPWRGAPDCGHYSYEELAQWVQGTVLAIADFNRSRGANGVVGMTFFRWYPSQYGIGDNGNAQNAIIEGVRRARGG